MRGRALNMMSFEPRSAPQYELRARIYAVAEWELEVWQIPAPATPHVKLALRVAGLHGRNFELVEHRILRRLSHHGIRLLPDKGPLADDVESHPIGEQLALMLGLLFRVLAPMRNRDNMRMVADGVEAMGIEEAGYWLGMAMHRRNPRRVLSALRMLLTETPRASQTSQ